MQTEPTRHSRSQEMPPVELCAVVASNIQTYLNQFSDARIGLRMTADRMGLHQKTLKRIIAGENKPTYGTLYKIYKVLLNATNETDLFERAPTIVQEELKRGNPKPLDTGITYSFSLKKELDRCPIFAEIYFSATAGPLSRELISYRYGRYGEAVLEKMIASNVLLPTNDKNLFVIGNVQANINSYTIKKVGMHFTERYSKPENADDRGANFSAFYIEGLTPEIYNEWLKIDEEAFAKKIALTKNEGAIGPIKAFTYIVTDTNTPSKDLP